jgi:hypothetical protein
MSPVLVDNLGHAFVETSLFTQTLVLPAQQQTLFENIPRTRGCTARCHAPPH